MKSALNKNAVPAAGPAGSPKHRGGAGGAGGSPMHPAGPAAGASSAAASGPAAAAVEDDEVSDYTDADESISAPTEFLAEFLSAIMGKDYPTALKYCKLILQYEPNNRTAREFYPLIVEKLVQSTIDEGPSDSDDDSSSGGSGSLTGSGTDEDSSSDSDLSDDEDEGDEGKRRKQRNDNSCNSSVEYGDTDGTTASYSSLEDEEADQDNHVTLVSDLVNDNEDAGNGNEVSSSATDKFCSDSESPTEPVEPISITQRLLTSSQASQLRARVVPGPGGRR